MISEQYTDDVATCTAMSAILCTQKPHFLVFTLVIVNPTIFD